PLPEIIGLHLAHQGTARQLGGSQRECGPGSAGPRRSREFNSAGFSIRSIGSTVPGAPTAAPPLWTVGPTAARAAAAPPMSRSAALDRPESSGLLSLAVRAARMTVSVVSIGVWRRLVGIAATPAAPARSTGTLDPTGPDTRSSPPWRACAGAARSHC